VLLLLLLAELCICFANTLRHHVLLLLLLAWLSICFANTLLSPRAASVAACRVVHMCCQHTFVTTCCFCCCLQGCAYVLPTHFRHHVLLLLLLAGLSTRIAHTLTSPRAASVAAFKVVHMCCQQTFVTACCFCCCLQGCAYVLPTHFRHHVLLLLLLAGLSTRIAHTLTSPRAASVAAF